MSLSANEFRLSRRLGNPDRVVSGDRLEDVFDHWQGKGERWLFISPHDDDVVMGGGLLVQKAAEEGVSLSMVITSDGSMGYCDLAQRDRIASIRQQETRQSFKLVGVDAVRWLDFPDCNLTPYLGRRLARSGDPCVVEGYTGIQNAYVHLLRNLKPTRLFLSAESDLHPDHKAVYGEALVSLFHAQGAIWPELGPATSGIPPVYEMAIYSAFSGEPTIRIETGSEPLETKLAAIAAFRSQEQIDLLVQKLRLAGPVEYLKQTDLALYSPSIYAGLFE